MRVEAQKVVEALKAATTREGWRAAMRSWNDCPVSTAAETNAILYESRAAKVRIDVESLRRGGGRVDFSFEDGT